VPTSTVQRFNHLELSRAIDSLYSTFDAYGLPDRIDFCPHCDLDSSERRLHARPLRELTWADLWEYCPRAVTTFGDGSDLRHFLPRILELYATEHRGAPCCLFVTFGRLDQADWTGWPAAEVAAVRQFIDAWKRTLSLAARQSEDAAWELDELASAVLAL
jgi:hypothetical protein